MPRPHTRQRRALIAFHVYNQGFKHPGGRPRKVFVDREDRQYFVALLARHLGSKPATDARGRFFQHLRAKVTAIAYCVMITHFHLILWQRDPDGIAELMNRVQAAYTRYFNSKYGNYRPLFNGPVRAKPVLSDSYFRWLVGYVHDNHPSGLDYEFSSHRAWVNEDERPGWIEPAAGLRVFGGVDEYLRYLALRNRRKEVEEELEFSFAF